MTAKNTGTSSNVMIVMGLHNGAAHLQPQLNSFHAQTHANWDLLIGDDGSTDHGPELVRDFAREMAPLGHQIRQMQGPARGFVRNYLSMLQQVRGADYVALADQDDVWMPEKLARGIDTLQTCAGPAMYCGARLIWLRESDTKSCSPPPPRPPSFHNALVENIAHGNTIMLNQAALALVQQAAAPQAEIFAHDWWLYLLITGAGGQVVFDPDPQLLYRQHEHNTLGAGEQMSNSLKNRANVLTGAFRDRISANLDALDQFRDLLCPENRVLLDQVRSARAAPLFARVAGFRRARVFRQKCLANLGMWGGILFGKI